MVKSHPCEYIAGSLPQVSATEMRCDCCGRLRLCLRSEWLRLIKGRAPWTDAGVLPRVSKVCKRNETLVEVHACGGLLTEQGWASNMDGETGQKTERALLIVLALDESSLLFSLDHLCTFGEAGGDGALKGYEATEFELEMFCFERGGLGSLL